MTDARTRSSFARHRTFRWNAEGDVERYEAVETTDHGLLWYAWSHLAGGGRRDEALQTYADFEARGPVRRAPPHVLDALRSWIAEHVSPESDSRR